MKAMLFAAGLGTRLRPLTNDRPKAMVEVNGKPLIEIVIGNLIKQGVKSIIVNVHHFADSVIRFLESKENFGIEILISDERDELLDTGGGLKKAEWFFDDGEPFIVHNVDIISDIDLQDMYRTHIEKGNIATLAVRNRRTSRYFMFDKDDVLCGWKNMKTNEIKIARRPNSKLRSFAFSGIHILNPEFFNFIIENGKFSITNVYIRLAISQTIGCYRHDDTLWMDLGKIDQIKAAEKIFSNGLII